MEDGTCTFGCIETEPGKGICTDTCGNGGNVPCTGEGYQCNELPGDGGEKISLCLPNASCGAVTFLGQCDGTKLTFCGVTGVESFDCAAEQDPSGQPLKCAEVPGIGFDCVGQNYDGGCGAETEQGRCDGNTRVFCESVESGKVLKEACPGDLQCVVSADGVASCAPAGTTPDNVCGSVTADGKCDGNTLVTCESGVLSKNDCGAQTCGLQGAKFGCHDKPASGGTNRVKGSFVYEKRALTDDGLGDATEQPVRRAVVKVMTTSDKKEVASGLTGDDGSFDIQFDGTEQVSVFVLAAAEPSQYGLVIRDCPTQEGCDGDSGNIYGAESDPFTPDASTDLGKKTISVASGIAGAFSLYDIFIKGSDFAATNFGAKPPPVTVQWKAGSDTACQTSCYSSSSKIIFIQGKESDTDEFDDPVLMHEWGHFLEDAFSRSDSPGGNHDGSPTDPRLAWGEGYGTFVGCAIAGSSKYIDTAAGGASVTQIDVTKYKAQKNDPKGMLQPLSEYTTAEILWKIAYGDGTLQGKGTEPIFDVLGKYFKRPDFDALDRGVKGTDLVDFLDGWYCREHASDDLIKAIVTNNSQFPYDYKKFSSCK